MPNRVKTVLLITLGLGALLLAGGAVSAGPATGDAPDSDGCPYGYGGCGSGGCGGYDTQLSDTQIEAIRLEKEKFYNATRDLRASMVARQKDLAGELAKSEPDTVRAGDLQNQLNDLKGEFNQRYLQYVLAMQKVVPGYGAGPGYGKSTGGGAQPSCCTQQ